MRIILVSPNRLLHKQWDKAIDTNYKKHNIYSNTEIEKFDFLEDDIVLFDYDNLSEYLDILLKAKIVCLSSFLNELKGFKLLKKGIKAYGNTYMTPMNLKNAINSVKEDKIWIYPELMNFIIQNSSLNNIPKKDEKIDSLSVRELEVAKEVSKGESNKNIALTLDITERTVKAHISSIFTKLEISDRVTLGITIKEYFN